MKKKNQSKQTVRPGRLFGITFLLLILVFFFSLRGKRQDSGDWRTYRHPEAGLKFNYPKEYVVTPGGGGIYLGQEGLPTLLYVKIIENEHQLNPKQWLESLCDECRQEIVKNHQLLELEFNHLPALKLVRIQPPGTETEFFFVIATPERIYHFSFSPGPEEQELPEAILSSLRLS
ncbi:MAG: hypothetical protein JW991_01995 [Candidatus Pacebacteria bacterium]|nr:hypothetical protein [Candidatus Paceibacterota bacterium]